MSDVAWLDQILSTTSGKSSQNKFGDLLPGFPSQEMQLNTTGLSGRDALIQAFYFYEDILACAESQELIFDSETKILDFGVCWGRIARFFLNKVPLKNIYGLDIEPRFVEMAQDLFRSKNFAVTSVLPPTNYPNNNFSLVTAYSVFSHLSESASRLWIEEFARIIKPRGFIAFTTRHETFFDFLQGLQRKRFGLFKRKGYLKALAELFPDMRKARGDYRNGLFVFATSQGVSGGGSMNETFYGEAFIPEQYVKTHYCHYFDLVCSKFDASRYDQQLFILQRNNTPFKGSREKAQK